MKLLRECLRCEQKLEQRNMVYTEGCWLCMTCFEHINIEYPKEMAKEYNHLDSKCKGCD